jgi:hypothetical protein
LTCGCERGPDQNLSFLCTRSVHIFFTSSLSLRSFSPTSLLLSPFSRASLSLSLSLSLSGSKARRGGAGHRHNLRRPAWLHGDHDVEVLCPGCPVSTPIRPCIALPWRRPAPVLPYLMWGRARPGATPSLLPSAPAPPCRSTAPPQRCPIRCGVEPALAPPPPQGCPIRRGVGPTTLFSMLEAYWEGSCDSTA